jgi:glutamate-ammonia-ligase adenylyltransferase
VAKRLVELCAHSQFLTDQIAAFPLLLDELLDERLFETTPTRAEFERDLRERMAGADAQDPEDEVDLLRQFQRAAVFRVAVPDLTGRLPLMKVSDRLTDIAELIVAEALGLSWGQITARHGVPRYGRDETSLATAGMVVVAYGKFGGIELGYGSDLDLVFLHDSCGEVQRTDGPAVVDNGVFFLRLVQRLVHLLTVHSSAGRLYEVDTRLRPSGKGGLLVQSLEGFGDYQRSEAWTWEHQALLRARAVAGPPSCASGLSRCVETCCGSAFGGDTARRRARHARTHAELSRSGPGQFDLAGPGRITDIEFLAQYWTLRWCDRYAELVTFSDNIRQLESLASANLVRAGNRGRAHPCLSDLPAAHAPPAARGGERRALARVRGDACRRPGRVAHGDGSRLTGPSNRTGSGPRFFGLTTTVLASLSCHAVCACRRRPRRDRRRDGSIDTIWRSSGRCTASSSGARPAAASTMRAEIAIFPGAACRATQNAMTAIVGST